MHLIYIEMFFFELFKWRMHEWPNRIIYSYWDLSFNKLYLTSMHLVHMNLITHVERYKLTFFVILDSQIWEPLNQCCSKWKLTINTFVTWTIYEDASFLISLLTTHNYSVNRCYMQVSYWTKISLFIICFVTIVYSYRSKNIPIWSAIKWD